MKGFFKNWYLMQNDSTKDDSQCKCTSCYFSIGANTGISAIESEYCDVLGLKCLRCSYSRLRSVVFCVLSSGIITHSLNSMQDMLASLSHSICDLQWWGYDMHLNNFVCTSSNRIGNMNWARWRTLVCGNFCERLYWCELWLMRMTSCANIVAKR